MNGGNNLLGNQGESKPLDKTLKQVYIDSLKNHIELLEAKKREMENKLLYNTDTVNLSRGFIGGLNFAINQLYEDINKLKDK